MEVKRQLDVLDRHLSDNRYLAGETYTIADMAAWALVRPAGARRGLWRCRPFPEVQVSLLRACAALDGRDAARPPRSSAAGMVNRTSGTPESQLRERHDAADFETKTADKLAKG